MPSVAKFQANLRPSTSVVFTIWLIFEGHLVKNCSDKHQHSRKNNIYHLNFFNNLVAEKSLRSFWNCWFTVIICSVGVLSMKLTWQTLRRTLWKTLKGFLKDYKSFQSLWGLASPAVGWIRRTGGLNERKNHGRGRRQHKNRCDRIRQVVCPLPYIAAGPLFTFRGKKGSSALIPPNHQNNLKV